MEEETIKIKVFHKSVNHFILDFGYEVILINKYDNYAIANLLEKIMKLKYDLNNFYISVDNENLKLYYKGYTEYINILFYECYNEESFINEIKHIIKKILNFIYRVEKDLNTYSNEYTI
jgi:hypothetical protein